MVASQVKATARGHAKAELHTVLSVGRCNMPVLCNRWVAFFWDERDAAQHATSSRVKIQATLPGSSDPE